MKYFKFVPALVLSLLSVATTQAAAQLDFPIRLNLVVEDDAEEASNVGFDFGTGLNDASGKTNAFAISYQYRGSTLSYSVRGAYLMSGVDDISLGGSVTAPLKKSDGSAITLQGGLNWFGFSAGMTSINTFSFPFGLGVQKTVDSGEADVTVWGSPRMQINLATGGGTTNTTTNFGASAGVDFDLDNPWILRAEVDYLNTSSSNPALFSVGGAYELGSM